MFPHLHNSDCVTLLQELFLFFFFKYENQFLLCSFCSTWEMMGTFSNAQVKVPVKFIIGDQDLTYHIPGTKKYIHDGRFKSHVPLLDEVVVIKGVGHFLHEERPEEISKHIHDYFRTF